MLMMTGMQKNLKKRAELRREWEYIAYDPTIAKCHAAKETPNRSLVIAWHTFVVLHARAGYERTGSANVTSNHVSRDFSS